MPYSLPYFYGRLLKVKTVENANRGEAMKDFLKGALVIAGMLALVVIARVAIVARQFNLPMAVKDPAPIAAVDGGCAVRQVKMPCFRHANPEGGAMAPVPLQSGSAGAESIASQDMRCAVQQVKFPCLQHTDPRS
jgi:hypothetical protein